MNQFLCLICLLGSLSILNAGPGKEAAKPRLVDINSANKRDLMKLPGMTESNVERIIAGRPYLTKAHLVTHKVLSQEQFVSIRKLIEARQPKTGKPPRASH